MCLQMEPYTPGRSWSVDWIVFGGNWASTTYAPARDFSLRVTLTLSASGIHSFSNWVVETMPGEEQTVKQVQKMFRWQVAGGRC
jgi:hypothetical protein